MCAHWFGCMVDGTCGLDTATSDSYFVGLAVTLVCPLDSGSFFSASNPGLNLLSKIVLLLLV